MNDWAAPLIAAALFAFLSPGVVFQMPGKERPLDFMNMKTSLASIFVHMVIYGLLLVLFLVVLHAHLYQLLEERDLLSLQYDTHMCLCTTGWCSFDPASRLTCRKAVAACGSYKITLVEMTLLHENGDCGSRQNGNGPRGNHA
ncbi:unnamed protein product [Dovyalis caffra]|uniref:Uncharacterized protein n=1 Tax=Dovyalis caffra TaxID=77055 RepID=A0AAV1R5S5_9ROSI|nr:unnamed protein product [Dovyalis caffra]